MFKPIIPALAVLGGKASGKTTAVEIIVKALASKDLSTMTVKHVSQRGFTLDREGTDTWRHWKAGARIVSTVSDSEKAIMVKNGEDADLSEFNLWTDKIDAIIFEGFSSRLIREEEVGKVICIREVTEKDSYLATLRGAIVALCSLNVKNDEVLKLGIDDKILGEQAIRYVLDMRRKKDLEVA
jgi:molybdopterin-guanine dinucleotide biosynthesis protein B